MKKDNGAHHPRTAENGGPIFPRKAKYNKLPGMDKRYVHNKKPSVTALFQYGHRRFFFTPDLADNVR